MSEDLGMVAVIAFPLDPDGEARGRIVDAAAAKAIAEKALATGKYRKVIEAKPFRVTR